jgi:hypothetical protein
MDRLIRILKATFRTFQLLLICVLLPLIIPAGLLIRWIKGKWLRHKFEFKWGQHGKRFLLVYSESPNWQQHIEEKWIPKLKERAVFLNWSHRSEWLQTWNIPIEVKIFWHWGGYREFNPMAIYFPKKGKIKIIRFWKAFKDFKHGKEAVLSKTEREMFDIIDELERESAPNPEIPCVGTES